MRLQTVMLCVLIAGGLAPLAACSDSQDVEGMDMTVDGQACTDDLGSAFLAPVTCGPMTCAAGKLCMIFTPGVAPPPDAGDGYSYSCVSFPPECSACTAVSEKYRGDGSTKPLVMLRFPCHLETMDHRTPDRRA